MLVALPEGHPLARKRTVWLSAGLERRIIQQAPQITSSLNLVGTGLGVSIVPASMARLHMVGVTFCRIDNRAPVARLPLAYRSGPVPAVLMRSPGFKQPEFPPVLWTSGQAARAGGLQAHRTEITHRR